jgi:hypothetical protein
MSFKIRAFKTIVNIIGLGATLLGAVALMDSVMHSAYGIVSFVSVIGYMGVGITLLIVGKQLNYALMDAEIDQRQN